MPVENTFWQKSKYRFQHISTDFIKEVRNLWILEAATDRRSVKIDILKSMIKLIEKHLWRSFFSKTTGNSSKTLLKMNFFTNIFQGFQTKNLATLQNSYFSKHLFLRGSAQLAFTCSNPIELTSAMYKVNNKDTRTTSFDVFLVSFVLSLNRFDTLF